MTVTASMGRTHTLIEPHGSLNGVVSPVWRPTFLSTAKEKWAKERRPKVTSPYQKAMIISVGTHTPIEHHGNLNGLIAPARQSIFHQVVFPLRPLIDQSRRQQLSR